MDICQCNLKTLSSPLVFDITTFIEYHAIMIYNHIQLQGKCFGCEHTFCFYPLYVSQVVHILPLSIASCLV